MRLVADENVPMKAVLLLREKGHDVLSISESLPQTASAPRRKKDRCPSGRAQERSLPASSISGYRAHERQ
jgi:hypothetical protein